MHGDSSNLVGENLHFSLYVQENGDTLSGHRQAGLLSSSRQQVDRGSPSMLALLGISCSHCGWTGFPQLPALVQGWMGQDGMSSVDLELACFVQREQWSSVKVPDPAEPRSEGPLHSPNICRELGTPFLATGSWVS